MVLLISHVNVKSQEFIALEYVTFGIKLELVTQFEISTFPDARVQVLKCASWKLKSSCAQAFVILLMFLEMISGLELSMVLIVEMAVCEEFPKASVDCTK